MNSSRTTPSFDDKMHSSERSDSTDRERLLVDEENPHWSHGKDGARSGHGRWLNIIFVVIIAVLSCLVGVFIGHHQGDSDEACTRRVTQHCTCCPPSSWLGKRIPFSSLRLELMRSQRRSSPTSGSTITANDSTGRCSKKTSSARMPARRLMPPGHPSGPIVCSSLFFIAFLAVHVTLLTRCPDRAIRVPAEEAEKSGLAADQVKISEKYGGGYPANVEGLHHLHCLVCQIGWR